jgi:hypothetical protein
VKPATWTEVLIEKARCNGYFTVWAQYGCIEDEATTWWRDEKKSLDKIHRCEKCEGHGITLTDGLKGRKWKLCSPCKGTGIAPDIKDSDATPTANDHPTSA